MDKAEVEHSEFTKNLVNNFQKVQDIKLQYGVDMLKGFLYSIGYKDICLKGSISRKNIVEDSIYSRIYYTSGFYNIYESGFNPPEEFHFLISLKDLDASLFDSPCIQYSLLAPCSICGQFEVELNFELSILSFQKVMSIYYKGISDETHAGVNCRLSSLYRKEKVCD